MSDRTPHFREAVAAIRTSEEPFPTKDKSRILPSTRRGRPLESAPDPLERRARDIVTSVDQLNKFLMENRHKYLDVAEQDGIGDVHRDKIDSGANNFIRTCKQLINKFKSDVSSKSDLCESRHQHFDAVVDILDSYLKQVCLIYTEQKAIRVEKEVQLQQMARLEIDARKKHDENEVTLEERGRMIIQKKERRRKSSVEDEEEEEKEDEDEEQSDEASDPSSSEKETTNTYYQEEQGDKHLEDEFTAEEVQMLEEENEKLYEELVSVQEGVQQVESKVIKIAELQEIFTEKVLQQKDDIELISRNATATTENVKDGNEELRRAIQNQASIRVYILFFLLVMSFSLLFLDWYND